MSLPDAVDYPFAWEPPMEVPAGWRTLREHSLQPVRLPSGDPAVLVTRYRDVKALFSDHRLSRNTGRYPTSRISPNNEIFNDPEIDNDPPRYLEERSLVVRAFSARRIESLRPHVWEIADELMDAMAAAEQPVDLMESFAFPLPIRVICRLLGVPHEEHAKFRELVDGFLSVTKLPTEEVERCRVGLWTYLGELIDAKRHHPTNDLTSELVKISDEDQKKLSDHQLQHWVQTLLIAGYVTTASQIGTSMAVLLHRPHLVREVQADFGIVPTAVEELLRYQLMGTSLGSLRYCLEDIELSDGTVVPKGSTVMLSVESNFDEEVFTCPMDLDIHRRENNHMSFGSGIHYCAGAPLARMELQVSMEGLLRRFPGLRLAQPGEDLPRVEGGFLGGFSYVPVRW
ncbi:cytochrome P450 [Actinoplanes siamensis]|uniref:Cytochrome P450 n=2 Tax=Actinoplanes siamensis TaxID=1223317 RepID=A0A919N9S5_9ACTN|nr:cytochrome P450 [Actinoplanes siamensis]GIF07091.1 cytochrome P450 [Actinoplanes siamensis]